MLSCSACHIKILTVFYCFRFCFPLQMHTKCELHKPPVPCPFQKCRENTCSTQPSARCRSFGCGSCDENFLDVVSQTPVKCNENGYYNYHSFIFRVWWTNLHKWHVLLIEIFCSRVLQGKLNFFVCKYSSPWLYHLFRYIAIFFCLSNKISCLTALFYIISFIYKSIKVSLIL